jgi:hypothetical protein
MRFAGAKEENGLLFLKFERNTNQYEFLVIGGVALLIFKLVVWDNPDDFFVRFIWVYLLLLVPLFLLLTRFFMDYELVFDLENKKVEVRHIFFYNSMYETSLEKCKFVIVKVWDETAEKYAYGLSAYKAGRDVFTLKLTGLKSAQRIKKELNKVGYDIETWTL